MMSGNEYTGEMDYLYRKSLILESPSEMDKVLYFYWIDAIAHLDYTLSALAQNADSIKCTMTAEYLRYRVDVKKQGDYALFPAFMLWLRDNHQDEFENTPIIWQLEYDPDENGGYLGFRIVLDKDDKRPLMPQFFHDMTDDLFGQAFIAGMYPNGFLSKRFAEFKAGSA